MVSVLIAGLLEQVGWVVLYVSNLDDVSSIPPARRFLLRLLSPQSVSAFDRCSSTWLVLSWISSSWSGVRALLNASRTAATCFGAVTSTATRTVGVGPTTDARRSGPRPTPP